MPRGEFERLINGFFDKVVLHVVRGYEAASGSDQNGKVINGGYN